ncbi:hypothetical protein ALC60_12741 [Trachymyrmex zeteki]|uniref:Uncharacterized protein n=1 Tax=Mycetomoellerius zeteki TaxID=64791 RepID=A0A151WK53_9HYME|nr:hypothetical protein ALC60_12741 [Trachymyrmex zeteki]
MRSGTAPLARHWTPSDVPFPLRYTGGPVVHYAPCQPQRTVAVSNENGQAHMVRTIALSVVPFYNLFTQRERERSGSPKDLTKTRFPELKGDADTSDWRNPILVRKLEVLREAHWSNIEDQHEICRIQE